MNIPLKLIDFAALSPLGILLLGSLILLLTESFSESLAKRFSFWISCITIAIAFIAALFSPPSHHPSLTRWLMFDSLSHFFTLLFLVIGFASTLLASSFFDRFEASQGEYYFLLISSLFGLILIGASADFLTLFIGLETLSIALYVLCGYIKRWQLSRESAFKYFLMGALATAFFLYGVALIYGAVGMTQLKNLSIAFQSIPSSSEKLLFLGGIALVSLGLSFKAAIVPFHVWAPDVYDGAPTPVTAFMAVGTKVGAFAAFARLFLFALPHFNITWSQGMAFLAILTMIYGNVVAIRQKQLRRFFAYSGIAHAGFLLIPILVGTNEALTALKFYLVVYALATLGCFAILAFLDQDSEGVFLKDLQGLFQRAPFLATILTICLFTLAGIPPMIGFLAKFYVLKVAFQAGYYSLVIVGLLMAVLSAFYYLRIVSVIFSKAKELESPRSSWPAAVVGIISLAAIIVFSCFPEQLMKLID